MYHSGPLPSKSYGSKVRSSCFARCPPAPSQGDKRARAKLVTGTVKNIIAHGRAEPLRGFTLATNKDAL